MCLLAGSLKSVMNDMLKPRPTDDAEPSSPYLVRFTSLALLNSFF